MSYLAVDNFTPCAKHARDGHVMIMQHAETRNGNKRDRRPWENMITGLLRDCAGCRAATHNALAAYAEAQNTPAKLRAIHKAATAYTVKYGKSWWFESRGNTYYRGHGGYPDGCAGRAENGREVRPGAYCSTDRHDYDRRCCWEAALRAWTRAAAGFHAVPAQSETRGLVAV